MLSKFNEPLTNEEIVSIRDNHAGKLAYMTKEVDDMENYPDKFKWEYKEAGMSPKEIEVEFTECYARCSEQKENLQAIVDKANSLL